MTVKEDSLVVPLNYLKLNQAAQIVWMALPDSSARYFAQFGFSPEACLLCIHKNPESGMSAYRLGHTVIALRDTDANHILAKIL